MTIEGKAPGAGKNGGDITMRREAGFYFPPRNEVPSYDHDGNLTQDGRWHYEWDGEPSRGAKARSTAAGCPAGVRARAERPNQNRLRAMQTTASAAAAGVPGQRLEFTYDGQSRRVRKVVKSFNPANQTFEVTKDTRFLYDGWNMIAELEAPPSLPLSASPRLAATHAWGLDLSGTETGAGGVGGLVFTALYSTTQTTANNSQPPPTSLLAPCYDGNGNVLAYASVQTGALLGRYEYDPFGKLLLREEDPRIAGRAAHLFSTKYFDAETGLSYYGFRYYSAEWGRWINRDPIGEHGGLNLNGMVGNDTINKIDSHGLCTVGARETKTVTRSRFTFRPVGWATTPPPPFGSGMPYPVIQLLVWEDCKQDYDRQPRCLLGYDYGTWQAVSEKYDCVERPTLLDDDAPIGRLDPIPDL